MSDSPIDEITPDELYQDIRRGSRPFILDVRNEENSPTGRSKDCHRTPCSTFPTLCS